jgi:Spy/CpxP family protein refolding chaperone
MRLFAIAAATLLAASAAPALTQPPPPPPHHGGPGWHHGRPHGGYHRWRGRRCTWVWRHHHRVRRCW